MKSREVPDYRCQLSILLMLIILPLRETFLNQVPFALPIKSLQYCWPGCHLGILLSKFLLPTESGFLFTRDPLCQLCNMSFCLTTEPLQSFWTSLQETVNMMLQINWQGRTRRWADARAKISQELRVNIAQARSASPNRGDSPTGSNRTRLGEEQLPQGLDKARSREYPGRYKAEPELGLECRLWQTQPPSCRENLRWDWKGATHSTAPRPIQ